MKKTGLIHLILMLVLMIATTAPAAKPFTIKLGVVTKPGAAQNIMAEKFKELVEAGSKGWCAPWA
jgi:TRAP-type C4-dicarboxylate transport system substrate-binding protein